MTHDARCATQRRAAQIGFSQWVRLEGLERTAQGEPVPSLRTLLADLGTLTKNEIVLPGAEQHRFFLLSQPTQLQ
ncbi:MAG: hypothetical protein Kow00109_28460 [Acidobacteriota bacterium]